ncbi:hypothetical protein PF005_g7385 [Phytophthora fragariae]|uniref:EGF-like domain-containing protein n=1 Tax=Phytophthora fragariae TaxID=53985 RepID=A0A6A4E0H9_9STRA|nr:hypothetical protein PF003_g25303 [Phytophthora fragariae]KAE8942009.1 hypothetical protein PF009_g8221 [Phytophthora fragariae]KAE9121846.1 hypothetical protein PF007_g7672 [Phytophthora fragariae]KAE9122452.1 hypothetical protein PF010_g6734 [Phytophthora fragariae]KAE9148866.1 hypothetical protein PF006_g6595 [Phytophthora fragariae]
MQPSSLLVALALLASPALGANLKVHHRHHMKFREVTVIADNAECPNGGDVLLCESSSFACQDDGSGTQKCLERDDSFLDSVDSSTTMPWAQCSFNNASLPSKCLFDFTCLCNDYANAECYCMPPDAWRTGRGTAATCTTSSGETNACDEGKYCRTKGSSQECATAPYLPSSTALYSDCTADGACDEGLTCDDYDNFGICVDDDGSSA